MYVGKPGQTKAGLVKAGWLAGWLVTGCRKTQVRIASPWSEEARRHEKMRSKLSQLPNFKLQTKRHCKNAIV